MTEDDGKLDLKPTKTAKDDADSKRNSNMMKAGIGIGIGSAAIVAALLYANRGKKTPQD
jgi:hypothetical protein